MRKETDAKCAVQRGSRVGLYRVLNVRQLREDAARLNKVKKPGR